ncbi:hypothetical protein ACIPUC_04470 [Streptomyces sp. LARHCF249]
MYEMRADSVPGQFETLWHVLARGQTAATLCGYRLPPERTVTALMSEGAAERYCVRCMTACRTSMENRALPAAEAGKEPAAG